MRGCCDGDRSAPAPDRPAKLLCKPRVKRGCSFSRNPFLETLGGGGRGPGKKPRAFRGSGLLSDKSHAKQRGFLVAHKVSQIIRSDKDYSFDIMNEENLPLVHFLFARKRRHRLRQAGAGRCRQGQIDQGWEEAEDRSPNRAAKSYPRTHCVINRTLRFSAAVLPLFETRSTAAICKDVVAAALGLDEAMPLGRIEPFHSTFRHLTAPIEYCRSGFIA